MQACALLQKFKHCIHDFHTGHVRKSYYMYLYHFRQTKYTSISLSSGNSIFYNWDCPTESRFALSIKQDFK